MNKAASKSNSQHDSRNWLWVVAFVLLLVASGATGLKVVEGAQQMRTTYQKLGAIQQQQDELLADHSRLMIERSARSSLQNIEEVAQRELDMEFPTFDQVVVP